MAETRDRRARSVRQPAVAAVRGDRILQADQNVEPFNKQQGYLEEASLVAFRYPARFAPNSRIGLVRVGSARSPGLRVLRTALCAVERSTRYCHTKHGASLFDG